MNIQSIESNLGFFCRFQNMLRIYYVALALPLSLLADNYIDSNLPTSITLSGGTRADTVTSTPSSQSWVATTIGYGRNPRLTLQGTTGSQYTLTINDSTTTYYSSGFSVGAGIQSALMNVHTLSLQSGSISVASGATFAVYSSGNTINAQGTEYGGDSKVWLQKGSSLTLASNATANFQNAMFFISEGKTAIEQNAKLTINATKAIRLQNSLTNNGGSIEIQGSAENIGSAVSITQNGVSTITNNGGNITIAGNFKNGGQATVDTTGTSGGYNSHDPAFGGGGNLIINGGNVTISGKLTSSQGGDAVSGGGVINAQNSSISVNGGTLTVTGGLENSTGSTISFGASNGTMGQIIGNVINNSGNAIVVNIAGANIGNYTLINGSLSGTTTTTFDIQSTEFISATQSGNAITLSANQSVIDNFKTSLNSNQRAILNAFNTNIYTYGSRDALKENINSVDNILNENLINTAPMGIYTLLAQANLAMQTTHKDSIAIAPLAGFSFVSNGLKGGVYGVNLNASKRFKNHFLSGYVGYGYGNNAYKNSAGRLEAISHSMLLALQDKISFGKLEADIFAHYGFVSNDINRFVNVFSQNHSANHKISYQELGLRFNLAIPFKISKHLTLSPYIGLGYAFSHQGSFCEGKDSVNLCAGAIGNNRIEGALGLRSIYGIKDYALFAGGEMSYGFITPNVVNASVGGNLGAGASAGATSSETQNLAYKHSAGLGYYLYVGGTMPIYKQLRLNISGVYAHSTLGFNTINGLLGLQYSF